MKLIKGKLNDGARTGFIGQQEFVSVGFLGNTISMRYIHYLVLTTLTISSNTDVAAQYRQRGILHDSLPIIDRPQDELVQKRNAVKRLVAVPLFLTAAGLYSMSDNDIINKFGVQEERNEWMPAFRHNADDYLQFVPIAVVYGLNIAGVKGKNDFANRTALLLKTELLVGALTYSLKKVTAVPRPDTGQPTSFPSGHTAQAFAAATFMAKEYGDQSIWYSIGAYTIATGVGAMRMMNNRHWVSDVLVGAVIGMLSTNLVYLTHQHKWGKQNRRTSGMIVAPTYSQSTFGVFFKMPLN